jgi:hypothetical protein
MIKLKPCIFFLVLASLTFFCKGQLAYSYTASLITNANDYVEKTSATLTVLSVNGAQETHYVDEQSAETLIFSGDSAFGSFIKGKVLLCGKGLKKDYFKSGWGKMELKPKNIAIKHSGNREVISGYMCDEIIVSYIYRIPGIELPFRSHIWVSTDIKFQGELNMIDFNETWNPEELSDSLKKAEALVFKQEIYFNDEKAGTAIITDFISSNHSSGVNISVKPNCRKEKGIRNYKQQVNQQRRAKESFNRLSGQ